MAPTLLSAPAFRAETRSIAATAAAFVTRFGRGLATRPVHGLSDQLLADIGLSRAHLVVDALPPAYGAALV